MSWSRVAWNEKSERYEDTLPACWVISGCLYWPIKGVKAAFENMEEPGPGWRKFPGAIVKLTATKTECDELGVLGIPTDSEFELSAAEKETNHQEIFDVSMSPTTLPMPPPSLQATMGFKNRNSAATNDSKSRSMKRPAAFVNSTPVKFVASAIDGQPYPESNSPPVLRKSPRKQKDTRPTNSQRGESESTNNVNTNASSLQSSSFNKRYAMPLNLPLSNERFQYKCFDMFHQINSKLDYVIDNFCGGDPTKFEMKIVHTEEELDELELQLENKETFKDAIFALLQIGGKDAKSMASNILRSSMSNQLQSKYSMDGRKGKKAFSDLRIFKVIKKSILRKFRQSSEGEIRGYVMNVLKYANKRIKNSEASLNDDSEVESD